MFEKYDVFKESELFNTVKNETVKTLAHTVRELDVFKRIDINDNAQFNILDIIKILTYNIFDLKVFWSYRRKSMLVINYKNYDVHSILINDKYRWDCISCKFSDISKK